MKLVEILARELKEWPEHATMAVQDADGQIKMADGEKPTISSSGRIWVRDGKVYHEIQHRGRELSENHATAIVTRDDWEAERAKLKATKANADGWVRHRGGKCPVEAGTLVDVKWRSGNEWLGMIATGGPSEGEWSWRNNPGSGNEIMKYRIHKPAEQPDEHDLTSLTEKAGIKRLAAVASKVIITSGPIEWRDRIRALDTQRAEVESTYQRQISEITQERESLVKRLAGEGLALVKVAVQPVEDMSDWRSWRIGDLAEVVSVSGFTQGKLSVGDVVPIIDIDEQDGTVKAAAGCWGDVGGNYKWHSRPAS